MISQTPRSTILGGLIALSIRHPWLVLITMLTMVAFSIYRLPQMKVDVFPELNAPTVVILTESGGLSADEVEIYVTYPIETAVNGLQGVRRVRSASAIGLSLIWVDLEWGADVVRARQLVSERLDSVRSRLPEDAIPEMTPISSIAGEVMLISLSSPDGSVEPLELRALAEFQIRHQLLAVQGVAQAVAIGGDYPEYQIHYDQDRLRLYGVTAEEVADAAQSAHSTLSAGYLPEVGNLELPVRQVARVERVRDIEQTVIKVHDGVRVTIGQVADVQLGAAPKRGAASDGGEAAVVLSIQKTPGTNTMALTRSLDELFDKLVPTLPEGVSLNRDVMRQSYFIQNSIDNVITVLRDASIIVTLILIFFLFNIRTTFITLTALPVSLAATLLVMDLLDLGINVMTLGGLAVALGVLVDDAIIDVENVFRRLRQNAELPQSQRRSRPDVIYEASNEIRPSMVFATFIIVIVFVPLLFWEGLEGRFFRPLALTYGVSILVSLLVALTLTPALCRLLMRVENAGKSVRETRLVLGLKAVYGAGLDLALRFRKSVMVAALGLTGLSVALALSFGSSFLPSFNEGTFTVFLMAPPGTSLPESDRLAQGVEDRLLEIDGVTHVVRRTGRAERDEHAEPVSNSEIEVRLHPEADPRKVRREIDRIFSAVPGITTMIGQPIEHRLSHVMSGTPAALAISVFGNDLDRLREIAKIIEVELRSTPGCRDVVANREVRVTTLPITYRNLDLAAAGLTPASAAEQVRRALSGEVVSEIHDGVRRFDLVVRLDPARRQTLNDVKRLILRGKNGALVRLENVADVGLEKASHLITRENAQRKAVVSCNVAEGYNLGDLVAEVRRKIDPLIAAEGFVVSYGGQFEAQQAASRTLLWGGATVLVALIVLLQLSLGSLASALVVLMNLPLALIGGVVAIFFMESDAVLSEFGRLLGWIDGRFVPPVVSIASLVGFITLFGIAVRNGILLVNHYRHLSREEETTLGEAVRRGSLERLVPILMTAVSAALGLIPLAWAAGEPGSELLAPLAVVVLGGLVSSTALNLFVVPAVYYAVYSRRRTRPTPLASPSEDGAASL